jgi:hypothetical protein
MFTAKFKVHSITDFGNDQKQILMGADTNQKSDYAKYTPSGKIEFLCTNPAVTAQIAVGGTFLLTFEDFTPAKE